MEITKENLVNNVNKNQIENSINEKMYSYLNTTDKYEDEIYKLHEIIEQIPNGELEDYLIVLNEILNRINKVREVVISKM